MQRLFPSFPTGWPGAGLLLLRAAAGSAMAVHGAAWFAAGHEPWRWTVAALALVAGALLLVGLVTPLAAGLAAVIAAGSALAPFPGLGGPLCGADCELWVAVTALALVQLGPGAFALDARRFGRREVVIPRRRPPEEQRDD